MTKQGNDIGFSSSSTSMINEAMTEKKVLWQRGQELIVSVPDNSKLMLKVFEGDSGNAMRANEMEVMIPRKICGVPAKRIDPLPIPSHYCCMLFSALPSGGYFLKPIGNNNNPQLDGIAKKVSEQFGMDAVEDIYVFDLKSKPKIIVLSVTHLRF